MMLKMWTLLAAVVLSGSSSVKYDVSWIPSSPEVLTYRSATSAPGELYQLAIMKDGSDVKTYIDISSPGFMKFISGSMTSEMAPMHSTSKILIGGQMQIGTEIQYAAAKVSVTTVMSPINKTLSAELPFTGQIIDPSQMPFLVRMLPFEKDAHFEFTSLDPRKNTLGTLTLRVTGEEAVSKVSSYRIECTDFEGQSIYFVEKAAPHRVIRIEQPAQHRTLDLIM